jgi:hypothetical protein
MRKPSPRVVRTLLISLTVALMVLMGAGFAVGYSVAPHDKFVLGALGLLAGAAIHMVACWVIYAVLAAKYRESPQEVSLWPHPPGSRKTWTFLVPAMVFGVAAIVSFYNHAAIGATVACLGASSALNLVGGLRMYKEIPRTRRRRGQAPHAG